VSIQSTLTVTGFVGSSVRYSPGENGSVPYASFRLGSTQRVYDRAAQAWRDGPTQWYTVKVWRNVARNVAESFHKGQPVVVTGRLSTDEWAGPDGPRTSLVIEASALGHDLVFGAARFAKVVSSSGAAGSGLASEDGSEDGSADGEVVPDDAAPADVSGLVELVDEEDDEDDEDGRDAALEGAGSALAR
jgi:single-strand DNA-binding protein